MARPMICRKVACDVTAVYFKPQGIPMRYLEEIELELDEVEALRLADIEDLYQADAAARMGVSRQTFGNIIARAHKKVATALLGGMALRIATAGESIERLAATNEIQPPLPKEETP
ncbi:DUF134 domain-containing protein [Propionivibrio sp.]|uniref:DUF134 domain-containing protein n=1 Tax=Propionivibrio sp. TaxID=2212460 RepID=UPI003BF1B727